MSYIIHSFYKNGIADQLIRRKKSVKGYLKADVHCCVFESGLLFTIFPKTGLTVMQSGCFIELSGLIFEKCLEIYA